MTYSGLNKHQTYDIAILVHHTHTHRLKIDGANHLTEFYIDQSADRWQGLIIYFDRGTTIGNIVRKTDNSAKGGMGNLHTN